MSLIVLLNNTGGAPFSAMTQAVEGILFGKPYGDAKRSAADVLRELKFISNPSVTTHRKIFSRRDGFPSRKETIQPTKHTENAK